MSLLRNFVAMACLPALACGGNSSDVSDIPSTHQLLTEGSCRSCRIVADTIAVLGDESDSVAINEAATPAMDSRGRLYILERRGARILVFGPNGDLLQTFGRAGRGPGEFAGISEIHTAPGDTLVLIGGGFMHVVSPEYTHVRQHAMQGNEGSEFFNTMLADGRMVRMAGSHVFELLDMNGEVSGPVTLRQVDTARCMDCGQRTFREGLAPGTIWSGQQNKYRIEQHTLNGELLQAYARKVYWFNEWQARPPGEGRVESADIKAEFSKPRLFGVRESPDSLLWTHVLLVDDPEKIPDFAALQSMEGSGPELSTQAKQLLADVMNNFVTMIEVVDPRTRSVLASREFRNIVAPMKKDVVVQMRLDEYGDWSAVVMRLRVEGR